MMNKVGLLLMAAALCVGCASPSPVATPTAVSVVAPSSPTSVPTAPMLEASPTMVSATATAAATATVEPKLAPPTAMPVERESIGCVILEEEEAAGEAAPGLEGVIEELGFALQPAALPDGFSLAGVSSSDKSVRQAYQNNGKNIVIAYPVEFKVEESAGPLGWDRPDDAVSGLRIGDQMAHIMIGGWSDASIIAGPALSPDKAKWDYEKSLTLFFRCGSGGGRGVDMAIQALPGPIDWISVGDIVDIAQSLQRIQGSG